MEELKNVQISDEKYQNLDQYEPTTEPNNSILSKSTQETKIEVQNFTLNISETTPYQGSNIHSSTSPYIKINSQFGLLKFLIDTGSTHSFIDPKCIKPEFRARSNPSKSKPLYLHTL